MRRALTAQSISRGCTNPRAAALSFLLEAAAPLRLGLTNFFRLLHLRTQHSPLIIVVVVVVVVLLKDEEVLVAKAANFLAEVFPFFRLFLFLIAIMAVGFWVARVVQLLLLLAEELLVVPLLLAAAAAFFLQRAAVFLDGPGRRR